MRLCRCSISLTFLMGPWILIVLLGHCFYQEDTNHTRVGPDNNCKYVTQSQCN